MKRKKYKIKRIGLFVFLILTLLGIFFFYEQEKSKQLQQEKEQREEKRKKEEKKQYELALQKKLLVLVNFEHLLPEEYNLKLVEYKSQEVDQILLDDYKKMEREALSKGIELRINTSYRSIKYQEGIYNSEIEKLKRSGYSESRAKKKVEETVNRPGYSEHHTGLALDFGGMGYEKNKKMWDWLELNSYRYGFILRYPKGKEDVTNISHEAWHYRYVGVPHAKRIFEQDIVLEEYLVQQN